VNINENQRFQWRKLQMTNEQSKMWELQQYIVKRQEAVDNFCGACVRLAPRDRRKVERFLKRHADRKFETQSDFQELWTKSHMRACYLELRDISPKVASAWRRWALLFLKNAPSIYYFRPAILTLADSLDCQMWIEQSSDGSL
jgi:hypothetical protein